MATNCKVVNKRPNHRSEEEKERSFKSMFAKFKREVKLCGVLTTYKKKQFFESNSEKLRRKKKEAKRLRQGGVDSRSDLDPDRIRKDLGP